MTDVKDGLRTEFWNYPLYFMSSLIFVILFLIIFFLLVFTLGLDHPIIKALIEFLKGDSHQTIQFSNYDLPPIALFFLFLGFCIRWEAKTAKESYVRNALLQAHQEGRSVTELSEVLKSPGKAKIIDIFRRRQKNDSPE